MKEQRNSIKMNDYWHIPRASLSPSSASSAVSSASSTQRSHRSGAAHAKQQLTPTHYRSQVAQQHPQRHDSSGRGRNEANSMATAVAVLANSKRGSRSSQGSSDSNNSTRSASSGSLLLTAANLERMTEIHRKQEQRQLNRHPAQMMPNSAAAAAAASSSKYNANLVHSTQSAGSLKAITAAGHGQQTDAIINIDPNLNFIKTKDLDTVSIASSMHFTMVNGEPGANKKAKKGLCDRGRQVTVLITSMSAVFLLLIMGMVYALEMRAREMPQS